jgi:hypothetical protein
MRMAAATCEPDRSRWLRVALAWQDLARGDEDKLSASFLQPRSHLLRHRPALRSGPDPSHGLLHPASTTSPATTAPSSRRAMGAAK